MDAKLSLVKENQEKRLFPRCSLPSLTFKVQEEEMVFQVANISSTGMRILVKIGSHSLSEGEKVTGFIRWRGQEIKVRARVAWTSPTEAGLSFHTPQGIAPIFFSPQVIQGGLKALHLPPFAKEKTPPQLKCWLKSGSLFEFFLWTYQSGGYKKIQALFIGHFVEWRDGRGLKTGTLLTQEERDTPLMEQGELTIRLDKSVDHQKVLPVRRILEEVSEDKIQKSAKDFILIKLSAV